MLRPTASRTRLALHPLEDRAVPASVVTAAKVGTTLTITAGQTTVQADVQSGDNDNGILITGTAGTVTDDPTVPGTTTVTGGPAFTGITAIRVVMKDGNDSVRLTDISLTGGLAVDGGEGTNAVRLDGAAGPTAFGSVAVTNGDGPATFITFAGTHTVNGNLTLNNSHGDSFTGLNVSDLPGDSMVVRGNLAVTNGAGQDTFMVSGDTFTVDGSTTLSNGNGLTGTTISADALKLSKTVSITNGDGPDVISLDLAGIPQQWASLTIKNGTGGSATTIGGNSLTVTGPVAVNNGVGTDTLALTLATLQLNAVSVNHGSGGSTTTIAGGGTLTVAGPIAVTNGDGTDTVTVSALTTTLAGVTVGNGHGDSTTDLGGNTLTITGAVAVTNRDGADTVRVVGTEAKFASVSVKNGHGDSATTISGGRNLTVTGAVAVANGEGADAVTVSAGGSGALKLASVSVKNGGGGFSTTVSGNGTVTGTIAVTNGDGNDSVAVSSRGVATFNAVTIANGNGGSTTSIQGSEANPAQLKGDVTVAGLDGGDAVTLAFVNAARAAVALTLGNDADLVSLNDSVFAGPVTIDTGAGADLVGLETTDNTTDTQFRGAVTVRMGSGIDALNVGTDIDDRAVFSAKATFDGGTGVNDTATLDPDSTFAIPAIITGFEVIL